MNFVECSLLEIRRRPVKSLVFMVTFSIIFTALILGLNIRATVMKAKEKVIDMIGPYYQLSVQNSINEGQNLQISSKAEDEISNMRHVRGVNRSKIEFALAGNFKTVKENEGVVPDPDPSLYSELTGITPESVILDANSDCALIDAFRLGDSVLLEGVFPAGSNPGVLLEERMAAQNQLAIGDEILISYVNQNEVRAEVTGIYRTRGVFSVTEDNPVGEAVYAWSPYNRIYASLDIAQQLYGLNMETLPLFIYVDSISNMKKVGDEIKGLDLEWENSYVLSDMTTERYGFHKLASQIEEISTYASATILYSLLIGAVLLSLVLNLFLQFYIQDAGILIALGSGKKRVVFQYLFSTGVIALIAVGVARCIAVSCSDILIGRLIQGTTIEWNLSGIFQDGLEHVVSIVPERLSLGEWGWFVVGAAFLSVISSVPLISKLLFLHPRSIFTE